MIKAFASGFTVSMCLKIIFIGYFAACIEIEDIGNACLMTGGFALAVFTIDGFYKSTKKRRSKTGRLNICSLKAFFFYY